MVFFGCDRCGESLKKNQVATHLYRCHTNALSCMDCNLVFDRQSYAGHVKCISENQKYGGKNFVQKANKGEAKQEKWVEQVERAIEAIQDHQLRELLKSIQGFGNIPQKKPKFINFLRNSMRVNEHLSGRAWDAIAAEAAKQKAEEEAEKKAEEERKEQEKKAEEERKEQEKKVEEPAKEEEKKKEEGGEKAFKWKSAIKRKLKENGGSMKVKKLKKAVVEEYGQDDGESIFDEKIGKAGVLVDGKVVSLSA